MGNSKAGKSQSSTPDDLGAVKKTGSFQISNEPVVHGKTVEDVHKYEAAPESPATTTAAILHTAYEELGQLPETYGVNSIFLIARDPQWLFTYWDIAWDTFPANAAKQGGEKIFLKVFYGDDTEQATIEINPEAKNWYIPVPEPSATYHVEIGYIGNKGKWTTIARSGSATTPADSLSGEESVEFATLPFHLTFQRLVDIVKVAMEQGESLVAALSRLQGEGRDLAFVPGKAPNWTNEQREVLIALLGSELVDRVGLGSAEIDQILRKELQKKLNTESASELAAKGCGAWRKQPLQRHRPLGAGGHEPVQRRRCKLERAAVQPEPREFFMHVNAEVIFYGGTHPDAKVTIDGKPITLNPDGTFRYHFKFPDADHEIPIIAVSPDGVETRSATLSLKRATSRKGDVGHTAQPKRPQDADGEKEEVSRFIICAKAEARRRASAFALMAHAPGGHTKKRSKKQGPSR